ncbi:hypothetical protein [Hyalangium gracile]|uniref:hypothetical protein n=1 Tax=Hyalangium gracile TaxID=394092 RepID=UPI001CCFA857|nr:hypothetical protein [Hyalangium gracile]
MFSSQVRFMWVASLLTGLLGCGTEMPEAAPGSPLASRRQATEEERPPPNGANGTRPSCFWAHGAQQALRALGGQALDQGGGALASIPLSQVSSDCREVLRSAVECALTPEQAVTDPVTGELYTGWWGLAPAWLGSTLHVEGRRYVTACMVQRLNYHGTSVPILLEGRHEALSASQSFGAEYPLIESTAYGDLFSSPVPLLGLLPAFSVFVCWEGLLPQSCGLLGLPLLLEDRICDDAPLCGLLTVGPCALSCVRDDGLWSCRPDLLSTPWPQTVRVRLEEDSCQ